MRGWQEVMQQPAGASKQQEGGAMRGRQEAMPQPAGMTRHDKRQHNISVFRVQTESTGKVAAIVILVLSINQNDWALEMNRR